MYSYIDDEDQMGLGSISHHDSNVNVEDDKKEVQDILKGIAGLKQRLEEIQSKCRHSDRDLKFSNRCKFSQISFSRMLVRDLENDLKKYFRPPIFSDFGKFW